MSHTTSRVTQVRMLVTSSTDSVEIVRNVNPACILKVDLGHAENPLGLPAQVGILEIPPQGRQRFGIGELAQVSPNPVGPKISLLCLSHPPPHLSPTFLPIAISYSVKKVPI